MRRHGTAQVTCFYCPVCGCVVSAREEHICSTTRKGSKPGPSPKMLSIEAMEKEAEPK